MKTYLYRASNLKSTITFMAEVIFWRPLKTVVSCDLFIIIGRAMRAPTLGCSIEISRDMYVCRFVYGKPIQKIRMPNCVGGITWPQTRACLKSVLGG